MSEFKINHLNDTSSVLPEFSLELKQENITAIYSDVDLHMELIDYLREEKNIFVHENKEGLYERLSVQDNLQFFRKWFGSKYTITELLNLFDLHACAHTQLKKCSPSEIRRVYYAKYYLSDTKWHVFYDPISSVNVKTMDVFIQLLEKLVKKGRTILILVSSVEHAFLLTELAYHLREEGLHQLEMEPEEELKETSSQIDSPVIEKMFKIPAKVDDKVILFDPTEIDYIESQSGKSFIYIDKDAFALDLTLTETEEKLKMYGFYRCHRSYIVNLQKVREIITWSKNTYSLRINNKAQSAIPLSRTKLHVIQEIFKLK